MWRVKIILLLSFLTSISVAAQAQSLGHIMEFAGVDSPEEMNPHDFERLEELVGNPLEINMASVSKLEESGLFTPYQAASLSDYRSRHGDILSFSELAAVDGFGTVFVRKLTPFISLESTRPAGSAASSSVRNELSSRSSIKKDRAVTYGMKYRLTAGERFSGGVSISRTASSSKMFPDEYSGYLALYLKRLPGKILLGDFNSRFGQGLTLWNGMSFSGLTSPSSYMRKASGISPSSSFTGNYSFRGLAADIQAGHTRLSVLTAVRANSLMPAANVSYMFGNGILSFMHYADFSVEEGDTRIPDMKTSADFAFCLRGTDVFAEMSFDWVSSSLAALGGFTSRINESFLLAGMLRYYPSEFSPSRSAAARSTTKCSNEHAASLAAEWSGRYAGKVSADLAYFPVPKVDNGSESIQLKLQTESSVMISESLQAKLKLSERIRTWGRPFRTELKMDISYVSDVLYSKFMFNLLHCDGVGLLGYAEGGYRSDVISVFLRQGLFRTDSWDDRIYVYERDAPASFNVPAYYGRGVWTALFMNWRFARWGRACLRAALTSYPFMETKKPGKAELKLQFMFDL